MKVLITGKNSYIGNSFEEYVKKSKTEFTIDTLDMIGEDWKKADFSKYDVVFHVAGIAHNNGKITSDQEKLYYKVNTDLTYDVALKASKEGVKQFIFMSSIIVYGASGKMGKSKIITKDTPFSPINAYGDSKVQAELKLNSINTTMKIAILRPPMIYGPGSKGNYPLLSKLAKITPIFPNVKNERSMLFIENLASFVVELINNLDEGVFFPQNDEYVCTSDLVKLIADLNERNIWLINLFNMPLKLLSIKINLVNKVFGNLIIEQDLSKYRDFKNISFEEGIRLTESN